MSLPTKRARLRCWAIDIGAPCQRESFYVQVTHKIVAVLYNYYCTTSHINKEKMRDGRHTLCVFYATYYRKLRPLRDEGD